MRFQGIGGRALQHNRGTGRAKRTPGGILRGFVVEQTLSVRHGGKPRKKVGQARVHEVGEEGWVGERAII
jgi:hypothetical protein